MAGHRPECTRDVAACAADLGVLRSRTAAPAYLSSAPDRWGRPWRDKKSALGRYVGGRFDDVQRDVITVTHRGGC